MGWNKPWNSPITGEISPACLKKTPEREREREKKPAENLSSEPCMWPLPWSDVAARINCEKKKEKREKKRALIPFQLLLHHAVFSFCSERKKICRLLPRVFLRHAATDTGMTSRYRESTVIPSTRHRRRNNAE